MPNNIFVSEEAEIDLQNILFALIHWEKGGLSQKHAHAYVNDIVHMMHLIPKNSHHFPTTYPKHRRFGNFVHRYRRNKQTMWYIIYNKDEKGIFLSTESSQTISHPK